MNVDVALKNGVIHLVWEDMGTNTVMYRRGTYNTSTTGIRQTVSTNQLTLSPVPAHKELRLSLQRSETKPCTVVVTDVAARTVFEQKYPSFIGDLTINTSMFDAGIYLIRISTAEGSLTQKFVVRH